MNVRVQGGSQLHYGLNGGASQNSRAGEEDGLQFLSQEEQECIQFFEDTIESLEESLEEDDSRSAHRKSHESSRVAGEEVDGLLTSSPARATVPSHQDIIDLVHPAPDLVQTREPIFNPTNPDFQQMVPTPNSHFEIKPRRDSLPSEYNPPLPSGSYGPTDSQSYHPPGCIPTPVLIAHQIAENQGGGSSNFHPSLFLRRLSLESEKQESDGADLSPKHGPPISVKPTRFPSNISVILGSKEHQKQPAANVNIQERRDQMLANLSGTSHHFPQENSLAAEEQKARNVPTRSISFKDPSPDKSRMEALSKLGLTRNRAMSGETPNTNSTDPLKGPDITFTPPETIRPPVTHSSYSPDPNVVIPPPNYIHADRKPEIPQTYSQRSHNDRSSPLNPSSPTLTENRPLEIKASSPPPTEMTSLEFNNYGGKSIVVNPAVSSRSEPPISPTSHEPKILPAALSNPSELNTYGGKTKVMTPCPAAMTRTNLPDILSSHIDKSQATPVKPEPAPAELNSYGGKSRSINSAAGLNRGSSIPAKNFKAAPPTPAPRPPRHSYHGGLSPQKAAARAPSPDHRRSSRSSSMFRSQGITVQFSGRGEMDESRREALRKLGLLKES
ncbi:unnamed protein product [Menidia menidia]|uniref:(Atlantic silverside) hypothetical protein n=1 Tax=Menidia menidia TaxID=238744 RepID=A0A8S4B6Z3_9TELE|nr:unnamed protein product [Menidia menidia]